MKHHIIITGTSRGLGEAIALNLLRENNHLYCISRTKNETLEQKAQEKNVPLEYFELDLKDLDKTGRVFESIMSSIDYTAADRISLFNNAGVLQPIGPVETYTAEQASANIHINLIAPITAAGIFIKHTTHLDMEKRIINISSGAAVRALYGWSAYCTSKAGLNMFTKSVALEQNEQKYPVKIYSFAPGVIDTSMQAEIRGTDKDKFIDLDLFIDYKEKGMLLTPDFVARKVITLLTADRYENGEFINVKDVE